MPSNDVRSAGEQRPDTGSSDLASREVGKTPAGRSCPCGCGKPARTKKGWGGRGCSIRNITPDQRRAHTAAWLARDRERARQILSENGSKGGRSQRAERWIALLEKWQQLSPREALQMAYYRGYKSGYEAGKATRGGGRRAA